MMKLWLVAALALTSSTARAQIQGCESPNTDAQRVTCANPALAAREGIIEKLESSLALPPDSFEEDRGQCLSLGNRTSIDECLTESQSARLSFLEHQRSSKALGGMPSGWDGSEQQATILQFSGHQPKPTTPSTNGELADNSELPQQEGAAVSSSTQANQVFTKPTSPVPIPNYLPEPSPAYTLPSPPNPTSRTDGPSALSQLTLVVIIIGLVGAICFSAFVARKANQVYGYRVYLNPYNLFFIPVAFSAFMVLIALPSHAYILVTFFLLLGLGCTYIVWKRNVSATNNTMGAAILLSQMVIGAFILFVWFIVAGGRGQNTTRRSNR